MSFFMKYPSYCSKSIVLKNVVLEIWTRLCAPPKLRHPSMLSPHAGFNKHCSLMAVPILAMVAESTPGVEQRLDNLNNNPIREVLIRGKPHF